MPGIQRHQRRLLHDKLEKITIDKILAKPEGRKILKKTIQTEMSKGNKLINENIPSELLPQKL